MALGFGFVEVRHRGPLDCQSSTGILFDIGRVFLKDGTRKIFLGFERSYTKPPPLGGMEPHGIPVVHTCLLPTLVGTGLVLLHVFWWMMEAIGRRWYLVGWI